MKKHWFITGTLAAGVIVALNVTDWRPAMHNAFMMRGERLTERGQLHHAEIALGRAVTFGPHDADAYYQLGGLYRLRDQHQPAVEAYSAALALDPSWAQALYARGVSYYHLDDFDAALTDLNEAVPALPAGDGEHFFMRGLVLYAQGDYEAALLDFTEAISIDNANPDYFYHRAQAYDALGYAAGSQADLRAFEALDE